MLTTEVILLSSSRSYPFFIPSSSMLLTTISPAPSSAAVTAQSIASSSVFSRPPFTYTLHEPSSFFFTSMESTTHWDPNAIEASRMSWGFLTAAELTDTLSAPFRSIYLKSSIVLTPPPALKGMFMTLATLSTNSREVLRSSFDAVMS